MLACVRLALTRSSRSRRPNAWRRATTVGSAEEAASGYVDLPLLQLDYGVATDLAGRAGRLAPLSLTASHLPGVTGAGTITAATLQVSYDDGATWTALCLDRRPGASWTTTVRAPRSARPCLAARHREGRRGQHRHPDGAARVRGEVNPPPVGAVPPPPADRPRSAAGRRVTDRPCRTPRCRG